VGNKIALNAAKLVFGVFFIVTGATKIKALSEEDYPRLEKFRLNLH
jgi:hypothetical protein